MHDLYNPSTIKCFYYDIYRILKETDKDIVEVWSEISEYPLLIFHMHNQELQYQCQTLKLLYLISYASNLQ